MINSGDKHVFISYVREDARKVDGLCAVLEAAGIPYWRDRSALGPGDAWKVQIRTAIRDGALVFLACFSQNSRDRDTTYMNEELTLAVEEFRKMPPGRVWLIPVRFDNGDVPEWDLGAGRMLSDLNYADLFGRGQATEVAKLVTTIHRLMGDKQMSTASAMAAVENAQATDRVDVLKRLTKEMLLDPTRRIELDDLVSQEVQRIMAVLTDADRYAKLRTGSNDEGVVEVAVQARELWQLSEPFCASLQVASRWADPDALATWANGLRSFITTASKPQSGSEPLLRLQRLPGMVGVFTATLACVAAGKWANLKALVIDPTVREQYSNVSIPLADSTDFNKPFGNEWIANTLARATIHNLDMMEALQDFLQNRVGKYYAPAAEWVHHVLRSLFEDQLTDQDAYDAEFDRAEAMLGALVQDQTLLRSAGDPDIGHYRYVNSYWFGRSTWRASHGRVNPANDLVQELSRQGASWGPLRGGLLGADVDRAQAALAKFAEDFGQVASRRW